MSVIQLLGGGGEWPPVAAADSASRALVLAMPCNSSYGFRNAARRINVLAPAVSVSAPAVSFGGGAKFYESAGVLGPQGLTARVDVSGMTAFGGSGFCVEGWFKVDDYSGSQLVLFLNHPGNNTGFQVLLTGDAFSNPKRGVYVSGGAGADTSHSASYICPQGSWFHLAVVRVSSSVRIFVNGVYSVSYGGGMSSNWSSTTMKLMDGGSTWDGVMVQDLRIYQGSSKYGGFSFTPPGAMFTA